MNVATEEEMVLRNAILAEYALVENTMELYGRRGNQRFCAEGMGG